MAWPVYPDSGPRLACSTCLLMDALKQMISIRYELSPYEVQLWTSAVELTKKRVDMLFQSSGYVRLPPTK